MDRKGVPSEGFSPASRGGRKGTGRGEAFLLGFPLSPTLSMNLRFVAAEVTRRIPLGDNSFRLITSAATRFRAAGREDGFRGVLSSPHRNKKGLRRSLKPSGFVKLN